jgi:hypothetical protein
MNKEKLEQFLFKARLKTYAGDGGKAEAALSGSTQLEFKEDKYLYRDVYYTGTNTFTGLETIYYNDKPVFSMCYFGNWGNMTEEEIDKILRGALIANPDTRSYKTIEWEKDGFVYECNPDTDSIDEVSGSETISRNNEQIYYFYYAGSLLVEE